MGEVLISRVYDRRRRDELWRRLVEIRPGFAAYGTKTDRVFPMFRLTRLS